MNKRVVKQCKKHGSVEHVLEPKTGYFRCRRCRNDGVIRRRRELKIKLVKEFGGRCLNCGYDKHPCILEFHHINPLEKSFNVSNNKTMKYSILLEEAKKCQLLCPNCHREEEMQKDRNLQNT